MGNNSGCAKVVLVVFIVVMLLNLVVFVAPGWLIKSTENPTSSETTMIGLWLVCTTKDFHESYNLESVSECVSSIGTMSYRVEWWETVQVFIFLGVVLVFMSLLIFCVYLCMDNEKRSDKIKLGIAISCFTSGILWFIGLVVLAAKFREHDVLRESTLSYSFGLAVMTVLVNFALGGITFAA
ncbi:unnamed protein product [Owenia fusiformis]|uniref:Uncharacterized protein n=1 Tax=Owenia fusiformis TaxID=6347 RepID=A0A8J1U6Z8_OWEFU|nr:unnamed protein product [Owenia fusiformis]CAH1791106.1 unnamed protein product [Owenia fusiformis]